MSDKLRVFLVEDEALIAMEISARLEEMGHEVCGHATRGEAALREIPEQLPDLVLMDVNLGEGLDGIEVAHRLRDVVDVPVIYLTAYSDFELVERAAGARAFAFVLKPFRPTVLRANVEMVVMRHRAERALREANRRLREAEAQRRREQERFSDLFEFAPDALLLVRPSGDIAAANQRAEILFGYPRSELLGSSVDTLVPANVRGNHASLRARFLEEGAPRLMGTGEASLNAVRKDGSTVPVDISLGPINVDDAPHIAVAVRDHTERARVREELRALEAQLRHAQKMEAISTLAGGVAHDFNNLLFTIIANVEIARLPENDPGSLRECLDQIAVASERASGLVRQMLSFSRREPSARAPVQLLPLAREAVGLLRAAIPPRIDIRVIDSPVVSPAFADAAQIHQVMMNLLTNAWHAIDGSGSVSVSISEHTVAAGQAPHLGAGRYLRLAVTDDGRGMDDATRERLFEPFFTTKPVGEGSGLGLSVVHGIVEEHEGAIEVDSSLEEGTTIALYLPVAAGQVSARDEREPPASVLPIARELVRVLLVDDEPSIVETVRRMLLRLGCSVRGFSDPRRALDVVREAPEKFDLVLTDYKMPDLNGLELAAAIAELRPELPVVLVSGCLDQLDSSVVSSVVERRLGKPFGLEALSREVNRARRKR